MQQWTRKERIMGDDPPYLAVGTEVSAKYKGAFCEAKVRKVVRSVKCKVTFKQGLGTTNITEDQIRGTLRVGSVCEVKHPERKEFVEATINKIQDCSQYTVVFDDGDITTLRRTALCLKSGRHFAESETLDQLPLTHPEHFGNPVIGGRKGRRSRQAQEESSDEEDIPKKGKKKEEKEADIGKVVCVELGDKKKQKDNWFPGLVVAPTAQDTVRIRVRDEYLVRSFKDGRYFTVPKKEATEFTREIGSKVDNNTLKTAVEKALLYLDRDELPPHWDRDLLFGMNDTSGHSDSDGGLDSDSSDDEPREEKDHFVAQLYKFMDDRGTPINKGPTIGTRDVDLYKLFKVVHKLGGYNRVTNHNQWKTISHKMGFGQGSSGITNLVKQAYKKFLHSFEEFYRKLGCTMVNHPRGNRSRHRSGRSLIRDRDRATPINTQKEKEKAAAAAAASGATATATLSGEKVAETSEKKEQQNEKKEEEKSNEMKKEKEEAPKIKEQQKKEKGKVKEEKDGIIKDEKKEKLKMKEEVDVSKGKEEKVKGSESTRDEEDKERLRVRETKKEDKMKEKAKDKDLKSHPLEEEGDVSPPIELKGKGKSREMKAKKEEKMKIDRLKLDDKAKIKEEKSKEEKIKEEIVKTLDDEKADDIKKKDKKGDDDEKQTRSKSKEDNRVKKEVSSNESRAPVRETDKRVPPKPKKDDEPGPVLKKRGRKRKDTDEKAREEETMGQLASYIAVGVGDKLKVYYGPTHESKVTYEAKVLDIEEDSSERMYLVHYTGWNTRYDEWIKRGRIADNLSWTPSRAKRLRQQQAQLKMTKPNQGKRGRPSSLGRAQDGSAQQRPRSTTPSSVTSSSSRTKSPATRSGPATRVTRTSGDGVLMGLEFRRRTRRMSGHTDISVASETESEEYDTDPEPEVEPTLTRSKSEKRASTVEKELVAEECVKDDTKKAEKSSRKKFMRKKESGETPDTSICMPSGEDDDDEKVIVEEDIGDPPAETSNPPSVEKRRSKRMRKAAATPQDKKDIELKQEVVKSEVGTESEDEQPKGRDFDLNQIRSELKGIEKAVKLPQELPHDSELEEEKNDEQSVMDDKIMCMKPEGEELVQDQIKLEKTPEKVAEISREDIYEFKEPEPFEFEVRTKRESLMSDERSGKLPRRSIARLFDSVETKMEKSPRKKMVRNTGKGDSKDNFSFEGEVKKRCRRTPNKKMEEIVEPDKGTVDILPEAELITSVPVVSDPVTPQKSRPLSACEEAFDKLCESPSFHQVPKPDQSTSTPPMLVLPDTEHEHSKSPELEQLSLLHDDDGEDDDNDRLVISETDDMETEIGEPLFSYPQRDHEELFPTLVSSEPSVSSVEPSLLPEQQQSTKSVEPPLLTQISSDIFTTFNSGLDNSKNTEKDELPKAPLEKEEIAEDAECATDLGSSMQSKDMIELLLKDDDEFDQDDTINAAIQRAMSQGMMDDDTNDMDIFGGKQSLCNSTNFEQEVKSKSLSPVPASNKKDVPLRENKKIGKKVPISKEFVESDLSDTDSSDEEQRLVIAKIDDIESQTEEAGNSSSVSSSKLEISESSEYEVKEVSLQDMKEIVEEGETVKMDDDDDDDDDKMEAKDSAIQVPEESSVTQMETEIEVEEEEKKKEETEETVAIMDEEVQEGLQEEEEEVEEEESEKVSVKRQRLDSDLKSTQEPVKEEAPVVIPVIVKLEEEVDSKKLEPDPDPEPIIILEGPIPEVKDTVNLLEESITTAVVTEPDDVKVEEIKCEEETENNLLGSLLCQETIPGSPAQAPEVCSDEAPEQKILLLEMPFASVPGSNCDATTAQTTAPISPTPAEHLQPSQSPVLSVPVSIAPSTPPPLLVQAPSPGVSKRNSNEAAPVMDNTPPTTPDCSLSTISGSPREEHGDLSPNLDNESSKSHRDSFEIDLDSCAEGKLLDHFSEDDSLLTVEVSNSCDGRLPGLKLLPKKQCHELDKDMDVSPKKRRRSRKRSECDSNKRLRHSSGRSTRNIGGGGSDSDDTSETSTTGCTPLTSAESALSSRSPRPSKYNFYVELAPELDGSQRIALLQQKLQELRKTYINVKAELACIDRRRKKLRRREREVEKATKQEVACS